MAVSEKKLGHSQAPQQQLRADEHVTELSVSDSVRFAEVMSKPPKLSDRASALAKKYKERKSK